MKIYKVYYIKNLINGKKYVGKTTKTLQQRFTAHIKNATKKVNRRLYDAMNCYGYENFKIYLLKSTDDSEKINEYEKFFIKKLNTKNESCGYNMTDGGDGGNTGKHHYGKSPYMWWIEKYGKEEADKIKEKQKLKLMIALKNKKHQSPSNETKEKISKTLKSKKITRIMLPIKYGNEHHGYINVNCDDVILMLKNNKSLKFISKTLNVSEFAIRERIRVLYNKTIYQIQKEIKLNNKTEDEIFLEIKNQLNTHFNKTIKQISNEIGVKLHICRLIFIKKMKMTFEEYRNNIVGVPLNKYGRKINAFTLEDIKRLLKNKILNIEEISKSLNLNEDIIKKKIKKETGLTFTQFKKIYYE
jgi:group I intron endonuclease